MQLSFHLERTAIMVQSLSPFLYKERHRAGPTVIESDQYLIDQLHFVYSLRGSGLDSHPPVGGNDVAPFHQLSW